MGKNEIYAILVSNLVKIFDIPQEKITPESRLYEDLDIDSIDAIDLIVRLKKYISKPMTPAAFKDVRTVQDVVEAIYQLSNKE